MPRASEEGTTAFSPEHPLKRKPGLESRHPSYFEQIGPTKMLQRTFIRPPVKSGDGDWNILAVEERDESRQLRVRSVNGISIVGVRKIHVSNQIA
jgi:hypothetical protein